MDKNILNKIEKGSVYAIIPARAGSKGVKNKNIKMLSGYPIIAYSIAAAKLSDKIKRVIVSTDSEDYAKIAQKYGAETPFLRPSAISGDNSTDIEFMQHAINWLYENELVVPEFFVHLRPTNPMRKISIIDEAIDRMLNDETATSLRSGHLAGNTPFKWFHKNDEGYFHSILGDRTNDEANNPRQAFPDVYIPDGYVDLLKTKFIVENDLMHGNRMIGFVSPDCVDIDVKSDVDLLEYLMAKNKSEILTYLEKNYPKEL
jgi:CMP-N-acetylneuraminic acid synthetase